MRSTSAEFRDLAPSHLSHIPYMRTEFRDRQMLCLTCISTVLVLNVAFESFDIFILTIVYHTGYTLGLKFLQRD
jgi:hypothetical protein